jgi:hypothetical protein
MIVDDASDSSWFFGAGMRTRSVICLQASRYLERAAQFSLTPEQT